jgi:ribosome maturation factor RimP
MDKSEIMAKVSQVGQRVIEGMGLELVGIDLERQRGGWFLRFFIDKPGGVTLEDCQSASKQLGVELDVDNTVPDRYTLEISSPGLDRPLRSDEDFHRFTGKLAVIHTFEPILGRRHFVGQLRSLDAGVVTMIDAEGRHWAIPRSAISKARLEVEF